MGVEARPTLKRVRAIMKLTAATMIISRVRVHPFERFERTLKNVSDEIRLKAALTRDFGTVLYGTVPDRLPVYTMSWNRFVQNRSFQSIHA